MRGVFTPREFSSRHQRAPPQVQCHLQCLASLRAANIRRRHLSKCVYLVFWAVLVRAVVAKHTHAAIRLMVTKAQHQSGTKQVGYTTVDRCRSGIRSGGPPIHVQQCPPCGRFHRLSMSCNFSLKTWVYMKNSVQPSVDGRCRGLRGFRGNS